MHPTQLKLRAAEHARSRSEALDRIDAKVDELAKQSNDLINVLVGIGDRLDELDRRVQALADSPSAAPTSSATTPGSVAKP